MWVLFSRSPLFFHVTNVIIFDFPRLCLARMNWCEPMDYVAVCAVYDVGGRK